PIPAGIKRLPGAGYVSIIASGWLLNRTRAEALMATGIDQINVSLNWPDERQDADRKLPGLWKRVSAIVPWMIQRGAHVQLNTVLMQDNLDEIPRIVALAETWRAGVLFTLYSELPAANRNHLFSPAA